jgi:O-antigen/teichoic acid export membrane protein
VIKETKVEGSSLNKLLERFKGASPAAKATMSLLFANLVLKGLSMISGPIFTRIMSQEQYGIVSTFLSWQSLLGVIVTLNLSQGVFNNGMLDFKENRSEFQFALLSITVVCSAVFFMLFLLFNKQFYDLFEMPSILIYMMMLYFLFIPAYQFWGGQQRYEYKYKALTLVTIGLGVFSLVFGIIFVIYAPDDLAAITRLCAMEGVNTAVGAYFFFHIAIKAKFKIRLDYCLYALKFNVPLIPHYMSMYILASSDRIMIAKMVDTASTAIYSVSYTIASIIQIFWSSIEASLSPWIYEKLDANDKKPVRKLTAQVILLFAVLCLGCTLFAPEIMVILAPSSYRNGIYVIPSVAAGVFFIAVYSLYMRMELFYKKTGFATVSSTCAAVANIVLNIIFIKKFGFLAAGYTTMFCYALLSFFHYMNVRSNGFDDTLDNRTIAAISVAVIALSLFITVLYSYAVIRYILIIVFVVCVIVKRKDIISIIKKESNVKV